MGSKLPLEPCAAALRSLVVPISHLVGQGDSMCVGGVSS